MALLIRQGIGQLLSVEQLNPEISDADYAWRRERIGRNGTFFLLQDEHDSSINMVCMVLRDGRYNTGTGIYTIEPSNDGCEIITITTRNSIWKFHLIPGLITGTLN